jgi:hypothetical protein
VFLFPRTELHVSRAAHGKELQPDRPVFTWESSTCEPGAATYTLSRWFRRPEYFKTESAGNRAINNPRLITNRPHFRPHISATPRDETD